jgi:DNA-binding HxlR family transcriptional regulator
MRSYGQYCALAKALDVIGDRWTLLIVRELLIRGACRYTDLRNGLPGIATNLLAERLRELEQAEIVVREDAPPPVATTLFRLTERGAALDAAVEQIGRWGAPLLASAPKSDAFCAHWIAMPARHNLRDHAPERPPIRIELRAGDEPVTVEAANGSVSTHPGAADKPDAVLTGPPRLIFAVLRGAIDLAQARAEGLRFTGDVEALRRVQPSAVRAKSSPTAAKNNERRSTQ